MSNSYPDFLKLCRHIIRKLHPLVVVAVIYYDPEMTVLERTKRRHRKLFPAGKKLIMNLLLLTIKG